MDLIEPDLVLSKDGVLVCMHDVELSTTTNVADFPEFADRKRSVTFHSNKTLTGWIVSDFTLAELKRLRVKQRVAFPGRDHVTDGVYDLATLDEMIQFVQTRNKELGTNAGLYIEMKHTPYFNEQGLYFEKPLIDTLVKFGYEIFDPVKAKQTNVLIQSFDPTALKTLRYEYKVNLRFVQLVDEPDWIMEDDPSHVFGHLVTDDGLDDIATYADIVAPWKRFFYTFDEAVMARLNWTMYRGSEIIDQARKRGLEVHTWTVRNKYEDATTNTIFGGSAYRETMFLFELGIDGLFTESPVEAMIAREQYLVQLYNTTLPPGAFLGAVLLVGVVLGAFATARRVGDGHIGPSLKPSTTQVVYIDDRSSSSKPKVAPSKPAEPKKTK